MNDVSATMYLNTVALLMYSDVIANKIKPFANLSKKEYAPYTKAPEVLSSPITSEMRLVAEFN